MTGEQQVMMELQKWGMANFSANPDACMELNDLLVKNYPCMREGICTPFGNHWAFLFVLCLLLLMAYFLGQWMKERQLKGGNDGSKDSKK